MTVILQDAVWDAESETLTVTVVLPGGNREPPFEGSPTEGLYDTLTDWPVASNVYPISNSSKLKTLGRKYDVCMDPAHDNGMGVIAVSIGWRNVFNSIIEYNWNDSKIPFYDDEVYK